jgi:uncharacterized peroxidase-related enzyme
MLEKEREDWLARIALDWHTAKLSRTDHALCVFAEKLTRAPGAMQERDVAVLRELGLDDARIHDAIQVVAYFNYINRVADAVHVDLEPEMAPYPDAE